MPLYDYRCQTCDEKFELRQSFSSEPVATCPSCNNESKRIIHSVPVVFKGSGFYVNDYGKGRSGSTTSSDSKDSDSKDSESKDSEPKDETKGESKAESKSESTNKSDPKKETSAAK